MGSVYRLTLRQLSGKWRLIIMTVLACMPVIIATLMLRSSHAPTVREFETAILSAMLSGSIAPLVVLAIAAAAFGNEVDDRTLANLTLSPMPRWHIALLTAHVAFLGDARATIAVTVSALVGVAMYASVFVWLGLVSTQAIGLGLLYIVLWEGFFSGFVSGVRLLSIRHYAIALMHALDDRRFASGDHLGVVASIVVAALVIFGFLGLANRRLRRMDVP